MKKTLVSCFFCPEFCSVFLNQEPHIHMKNQMNKFDFKHTISKNMHIAKQMALLTPQFTFYNFWIWFNNQIATFYSKWAMISKVDTICTCSIKNLIINLFWFDINVPSFEYNMPAQKDNNNAQYLNQVLPCDVYFYIDDIFNTT